MIDDAERLDAALNRQEIGASVDDIAPQVQLLVDMALEVAESFHSFELSPADHERLYSQAMLRLDAARHLWKRVHLGGRGVAIIGGTAATVVTIAAIGVAVRQQRKRSSARRELSLL
jgi:hypothetical protein